MRVALIGSVSSSWRALRALVRGGVEVVGVLGLDERHAGRVSDYCPLRGLAEWAGVAYRSFDRIDDPQVVEALRTWRADLLFVIGLSQLVPRSVLETAPGGGIGFHPTLLPEGRGRAPVAWTILRGTPAAVSLFYLSDEADAGDLVAQRPVPVGPEDYAADLIERTNEVLEETLLELCGAIRRGRLPRTPQDHSRATWTARRRPEDGRIDWGRPAEEVYRLVRAASHPYPGAFTWCAGRRLIVWRARPHERDDHCGVCGQIVRVHPERGILVQCGPGLLWLTLVQFAGEDEFAGYTHFRAGERLGRDFGAELDALRARVEALEARTGGRHGEGSDR